MVAAPTGRNSWKDRAACRGEPDLFFPERGDRRGWKEAKRICDEECPVRSECLTFALSDPALMVAGVFGGLSPKQRRDLAGRGA
jgi:hypothetical protein